MFFNVAQLLKSPIGTTRQYDVDHPLPTIDENPLAEPVRGRAKLVRTRRGVLVEADLSTAARLQCSRCLEDVVAPLKLHFEEEFLPTIDVVTGAPVAPQPGDDDSAFKIDEHHQLDLAEAVRQYGLLEIPLQPLCRENCAGLCPTCGKNRNDGACECAPEPDDPRLAAFRRFLAEVETPGADRRGDDATG
jgi:uncharacterized protein